MTRRTAPHWQWPVRWVGVLDLVRLRQDQEPRLSYQPMALARAMDYVWVRLKTVRIPLKARQIRDATVVTEPEAV